MMLQVGFGMRAVVSTMTVTTSSTPVIEVVKEPAVGIILQSLSWVVAIEVIVVVVRDDVQTWHESGTVSMIISMEVAMLPFTFVLATIEVVV